MFNMRAVRLIVPDFELILAKLFERDMARTAMELHKSTGISYAHVHNIKKLLIEKGWLQSIRKGQRDMMTLTDEGSILAEACLKITNILGINSDNVQEFKLKGRKSYAEVPLGQKIEETIIDVDEKDMEYYHTAGDENNITIPDNETKYPVEDEYILDGDYEDI